MHLSAELACIYHHQEGKPPPKWFSVAGLDTEGAPLLLRAVKMLRHVEGGVAKTFGSIHLHDDSERSGAARPRQQSSEVLNMIKVLPEALT